MTACVRPSRRSTTAASVLGTAGFCLPTGCLILNRCTCCLVPSGLGRLPRALLLVLFLPPPPSAHHLSLSNCPVRVRVHVCARVPLEVTPVLYNHGCQQSHPLITLQGCRPLTLTPRRPPSTHFLWQTHTWANSLYIFFIGRRELRD